MSITVCIAPAKTLEYPEGGGHLWEYLNWALGLRALGCKVIWLEAITGPLPLSDTLQCCRPETSFKALWPCELFGSLFLD